MHFFNFHSSVSESKIENQLRSNQNSNPQTQTQTTTRSHRQLACSPISQVSALAHCQLYPLSTSVKCLQSSASESVNASIWHGIHSDRVSYQEWRNVSRDIANKDRLRCARYQQDNNNLLQTFESVNRRL